MSNTFAAPVMVSPDGVSTAYRRVPLGPGNGYSEGKLQELLFEFPCLLPVEEIDSSFVGLVPICRELTTDAGPIDLIYATRDGRLALVETKLWRNPEARREVVGQIIDYAAQASLWTVEDLQRVVFRRTGRQLLEIIKVQLPDLDEAAFCDGVSRSLRHGRFLLLICGDGIREGTERIARYLNRSSTLDFTLGLVEIAVFEDEHRNRIFQPRVLAKTETIIREARRFNGGGAGAEEDIAEISERPGGTGERQDKQEEWLVFWREVEARLVFADPNHLTFKPERRFRAAGMWGSDGVYLLTYFDSTTPEIGTGLSFDKEALQIYETLLEERDNIEKELGYSLIWTVRQSGRPFVGAKGSYRNTSVLAERNMAVEWFARSISDFDAVLRPRIEGIERTERD